MPRVKPHHHPCYLCKTKTECPGAWEENYDGFPEVICAEYHGKESDFLCEGCEWKKDDDDDLSK